MGPALHDTWPSAGDGAWQPRRRITKASARKGCPLGAVAAEGKDPIKEREAISRAASRADTRLRVIAEDAFEARKAELKNDGKAGRWFSPLELHVLPKLGQTPIEEIDQRDIRDVLMPIWHEKADTARKAMNPSPLRYGMQPRWGLRSIFRPSTRRRPCSAGRATSPSTLRRWPGKRFPPSMARSVSQRSRTSPCAC